MTLFGNMFSVTNLKMKHSNLSTPELHSALPYTDLSALPNPFSFSLSFSRQQPQASRPRRCCGLRLPGEDLHAVFHVA